jgi:hypothetical protein
MSQFKPEEFMSEPTEEKFESLRKDDLIALGKHLEIESEIKSSMRKREIQKVIMEHLVHKETFEQSALGKYKNTQTQSPTATSNSQVNLTDQNGSDKLDRERRQWQREEEERQWQRKQEERQWEREREEREFRLKQQQLEVELKRLEIQANSSSSLQASKSSVFDFTKHIRMVPPFQEQEVDKYFLHFEKVAKNCAWPKEHWTMLLQSVLTGKARDVYSELSAELSSEYDTVKELILKGYELVPEAYRQKFRNLDKNINKTYVQFAQEKEQLFDRWCLSEDINKEYERLRELVLLEEFKRCINSDTRTFINEQKPKDLIAAARLADEYSLTHKFSTNKTHNQSFFRGNNQNHEGRQPPRNFLRNYPENVNGLNNVSRFEKPKFRDQNFNNNNNRPRYIPPHIRPPEQRTPFKPLTCGYCRGEGHTMSNCYKLKNKEAKEQQNLKPTGVLSNESNNNKRPSVSDQKPLDHVDPIMKVFQPFVFDGSVSFQNYESANPHIKILRDTGASQSLILANTLPFSEKSYAGKNALIRGINAQKYTSVPLHNINLQSKLVSGEVQIGIIDSLPFDGIHLILGNDLAGSKVNIDPILSDKPIISQSPDPIEDIIPNLYPSCAVTRAMSKQQLNSQDADDVDISDTFLPTLLDNSRENSEKFSTSNLITEQQNDPDISVLIQHATDETDAANDPICYFMKDGILMRKWRPSTVPVNEEWLVRYQIVIPKTYRSEVLSLAHETPLSGHLGINKTYQKIITHFYWPGIRKDVVEFCKTCHTCQVVGKPNQTIPKAPLKPIPAFEEPFSRVLIDCVGPLPKTKKGNQYLLTIMCASTRFPEAIPLRNIKTKTIVQALTKYFTLVGLPKSIQSDQGSNFMSGIFQQVMHELQIKQYKSTAYHPESQGALERFHQTLKRMMRTYCLETEKDWDDGVHLLLFAARESVQDSLGFSPFELVFGHTVRGPLNLLKDKLLSASGNSLDLSQYVSDFRTKLSKACELAKANLQSAQKCMKNQYDKNCVSRTFRPGDKVLALLPVPGNTLQARYFGPYLIEKKENDLNYVIVTPDRRKTKQLCHVNMLKSYYERKSGVQVVNAIEIGNNTDIADTTELFNLSESTKLHNSDVLRNIDHTKLSHLNEAQRRDIKVLVQEYQNLFPDVPSRTDRIAHDVEINDASPIKQHPYRLNPTKQKHLQAEIEYLLENDFIEPSQSNWSSPCLLVPKPDGSYRMCTDYRKLNNVTKADTFPIPRIDDCVDKIGTAKYVSKFDLLKGFWQIPLTERAKEVSAFVTPKGLYQYKVMPFGMRNSPATFQRLINSVIADIEGCEGYIDDVVIYSDTWEEHLMIMRKFFKRLSEANLTINLIKSEFGCGHVTYLGHVVGQGQVKPVEAKVEAISMFPQPASKKHVMRFLGMAGYYRKFCPNFSAITEPLTRLLQKNVKFHWTEQCQFAFEQLKAMLQRAPVLSAPDFTRPFKLAVDASDVAAGGVLLQEDQDGIDHPVCYFSRKFNKNQKNYSTIEKECLALILALQHFNVYVSSTEVPLIVYSDHNPLVFLHKLKDKNQRLLRWSLILSEYNMKITHIKGRDNLIADCLSRP